MAQLVIFNNESMHEKVKHFKITYSELYKYWLSSYQSVRVELLEVTETGSPGMSSLSYFYVSCERWNFWNKWLIELAQFWLGEPCFSLAPHVQVRNVRQFPQQRTLCFCCWLCRFLFCQRPMEINQDMILYLVFCMDTMTDIAIIGFCIVYASPKVHLSALNHWLKRSVQGFITVYNCIYLLRLPSVFLLFIAQTLFALLVIK